jgi:diguanylate cyclase (GGDEF)-like protein/PAS domain S-box-containing protein
LEATGAATFIVDLDNDSVSLDGRWPALLGSDGIAEVDSLAELLTRMPDKDRRILRAAFAHYRAQPTKEGLRTQVRFRRSDGGAVWVEVHAGRVPRTEDHDGWVMAGTCFDISARKQGEHERALSERVFASAREGAAVLRESGEVVNVNDALLRITGLARETLIGSDARQLAAEPLAPDLEESMRAGIRASGRWKGEIAVRRRDGSSFPATVVLVASGSRSERAFGLLIADEGEVDRHRDEARFLAHHDGLTRLPNRMNFVRQLDHLLHQQPDDFAALVVYVDLDDFHVFNNRNGRLAGDAAIQAMAERIAAILDPGHILARVGGDEIAIAIAGVDDEVTAATHVERIAGLFPLSPEADDPTIYIDASLGASFGRLDSARDAETILREADQAMYQAKLAGKGHVAWFDAVVDQSARALLRGRRRLRRAIEDDELCLWYQPKVDMATGEVIGVEALLRWQHPKRGLLNPGEFLHVIQGDRTAIDLGHWVLENALQQAGEWARRGMPLRVSINVAPEELMQDGFIPHLLERLAAHEAVSADSLELEILETSAIEDMARASEVIKLCRKHGIQVSLDDFGTGYSSLTYLKMIEVQTIKLDQTFVRTMLDDVEQLPIIIATLEMAQSFRRQVLAEGVESERHGRLLLDLGCRLGQGYGIARPMPADQLPDWVANWRLPEAWRERASVLVEDRALLLHEVERSTWIRDLERAVTGQSLVSADLDSRVCYLGQWLRQPSTCARFGGSEAFGLIEQTHEDLHDLARLLDDKIRTGRRGQAEALLEEFRTVSEDLITRVRAITANSERSAVSEAC